MKLRVVYCAIRHVLCSFCAFLFLPFIIFVGVGKTFHQKNAFTELGCLATMNKKGEVATFSALQYQRGGPPRCFCRASENEQAS